MQIIFDLVDGPQTARMVHFVMDTVKKTEDISTLHLTDFPVPIIVPIFEADPAYIFKFASALMIAHTEALFPNLMEFEVHNGDVEKICLAIFEESFYLLGKHLGRKAPKPFKNSLGTALKEWSERHQREINSKHPDHETPQPQNRLVFLFGENPFNID